MTFILFCLSLILSVETYIVFKNSSEPPSFWVLGLTLLLFTLAMAIRFLVTKIIMLQALNDDLENQNRK